MPYHDYRCKNNHIITIYIEINQSPDISQTCPECENTALYDWSAKRITAKVKNGTNGGYKMNKILQQYKEERRK